ncbi:MAG: ORF6N domain-containing protein [Chthoniobacterales bacterium]|nr:ORF6N domain-containing protein [Chthoniobacterales bacterium]
MKIPFRHIRDVALILDPDLAAIYIVPTKRLNEQVKRNRERFPSDFVFKLTSEEARGIDASRVRTSSTCPMFSRSTERSWRPTSCAARPRRSVNWVSMFASGTQPAV